MKYINYINEFQMGNEKGIEFIETILNKYLLKNKENQTEIEHILDYLYVKPNLDISKFGYKRLYEKAEAYFKKKRDNAPKINKEKDGAVEIIKQWENGFKMVKLVSEEAYIREGQLMNHCVASYFGRKSEIYSLRDERNYPHCTIEKNNQIKGKGNNAIIPKYIKYVIEFLEESGMNIRDSEMENLGYKNMYGIDIIENELYRGKYLYEGEKLILKDGWKEGSLNDLLNGETNIFINSGVVINKYISIKGNFIVGGNLNIYSEAKLEANNLKSVGGYLDIHSEAKLEANNLKSVGGYLYINSEAKLEANNLKSVGGYLYINSKAKLEANNLKSVGGYLYIYSKAKLDNLKSVNGKPYTPNK